MTMIKAIKKLWALPEAIDLAKLELEQAERECLKEQAATEYHSSPVTFNKNRIARLKNYLKDNSSMEVVWKKLI
jgi:hypothetical protein